MTDILKKLEQNKLPFHFAAAIISFLLIFSRRPDAVLNPQFWAEDGAIWYADAYNHGIIYSFLMPVAGYYQTISRLIGVFAQNFPLEYAPSIFNFFAIFVKMLVVQFILSTRLSKLVPSLAGRILLAFVYLAVPSSFEVHANLTNVQWHLALLGCLIILAAPSAKAGWKIFDAATLAISALSGPFCLLLLPIAALKFWARGEKWTLELLTILFVGCAIQATALISTPRPTQNELGANIGLLLNIIGGQIFFASIFGEYGYARSLEYPFLKLAVKILVNLAGFSVILYALIKSSLELRLFILFSSLICLAALISPAASSEIPQWQALGMPGVGGRYWFIPIYCFLTVLIFTAARAGHSAIRYAAAAVVLFALIGIIADWKYLAYEDLNFQQYAAEFNRAEAGTEFSIPINPQWEMKLVKKR